MDRHFFAVATRAFALQTFVLAAFLTVTTAANAQADAAPQDWVPEALVLPADIEVLTDREIGSSLRMFSFSTAADVDALLADWQDALQLAGFTITQAQDEALERVIEFSGQSISNAKIAVTPSTLDDRHVIEFDATLQ
jgi:hypothetical protein